MRSEEAALVGLLLGCAWRVAGAVDLTVNVTDNSGRPLQDTVVYAEPLGQPAPADTGVPRVTIDQVNKRFVPAVTVIRTGTEVSFPNSDNFRHSIYSFSPAKAFTTKLYSGRQAPPVVFDKPGLVVLGCNIHDTMTAWIVVVDTPFFTKSRADGVAVIKDLGPGDYKLSAWYPAPAFKPVVSQIHIEGESLTRRVQIDVAASSLKPAGQ
ncbi:MAG: methylamine utilization protein [Proteobacteria bacterium]|nr:methylamine utilization protein [Pseudomonadota bacterium]